MGNKNQKTFFVIGFIVVLVSGLFVCRFKPTDPETQKDQKPSPPVSQAPAPYTPDLKRHGFSMEKIQKGLPRHGQWRGSPEVADFNRDGNLDLVCSNRKGDGLHVYLGDGHGGFADHSEGFDHLLGYGGAAVGDIDGNGVLDVLFSTHRVPMVAYFYDGKSTWKECSKGFNNNEIFHDVAAADYDGDGHLDVVGLGLFGGGLVLFTGDGAGHWKKSSHRPMEQERFGREVITADLNKDGKPDLVATHIGVRALVNKGNEQFDDLSQGLPVPRTLGTYSGVATADVDGKGWMEIAATSIAIEGNRGLAVYRRGEDGTWAPLCDGLPTGVSHTGVAFADFNLDGKPDLVAGSEEKGISFYLGDGTGKWTMAGTIPETRLHKMTLVTGDFNNDKRPDLIVVYPDSPGGVMCFLNRAIQP